jgi:hypothetical protein
MSDTKVIHPLDTLKSLLTEIVTKFPIVRKTKDAPATSLRPSPLTGALASNLHPQPQSHLYPSTTAPETLRFSSAKAVNPQAWCPSLILIGDDKKQSVHKLCTRMIAPFRFANCSFVLGIFDLLTPDDMFTLLGSLPRSYYSVLQEYQHSFVWDWPSPDNAFFQGLAGLRKTCYVRIQEENTGQVWEMHLKPSKERTNLFGYLCRPGELNHKIEERENALIRARKIPLVLDLDDTLVRVVYFNGAVEGRSVPQDQASLVPHRVEQLRDGRRVVMAERVHDFLAWAQQYFEISICSLGDQVHNFVILIKAVCRYGGICLGPSSIN